MKFYSRALKPLSPLVNEDKSSISNLPMTGTYGVPIQIDKKGSWAEAEAEAEAGRSRSEHCAARGRTQSPGMRAARWEDVG